MSAIIEYKNLPKGHITQYAATIKSLFGGRRYDIRPGSRNNIFPVNHKDKMSGADFQARVYMDAQAINEQMVEIAISEGFIEKPSEDSKTPLPVMVSVAGAYVNAQQAEIEMPYFKSAGETKERALEAAPVKRDLTGYTPTRKNAPVAPKEDYKSLLERTPDKQENGAEPEE